MLLRLPVSSPKDPLCSSAITGKHVIADACLLVVTDGHLAQLSSSTLQSQSVQSQPVQSASLRLHRPHSGLRQGFSNVAHVCMAQEQPRSLQSRWYRLTVMTSSKAGISLPSACLTNHAGNSPPTRFLCRRASQSSRLQPGGAKLGTRRLGDIITVQAKCMPKYYTIVQCWGPTNRTLRLQPSIRLSIVCRATAVGQTRAVPMPCVRRCLCDAAARCQPLAVLPANQRLSLCVGLCRVGALRP